MPSASLYITQQNNFMEDKKMKEKLQIAKHFRLSQNSFSRNPKHKSLITKCYKAYCIQCILRKRETFILYWGSYYIQSFSTRVSDWCNYVFDCIYKFFLVHFTPNDDKTLKKYELIHYKVMKPIHIKRTYFIDELFLSYYLKGMGFEIVNEQISSLSTTYEIAKL